MKEVIYLKHKKEYSKERCKHCGAKLYHSPIPCPDGREGCLVMHYGLRCENCERIYQ